jgi:hypothetical protein
MKSVMTDDERYRELRRLADEVPAPSIGDLLRLTRRQLLEYARSAGLRGLHRLTKAALAARFKQELERRAGAPGPTGAPRKFDLGPTFTEAEEKEDIPWGHGQDRVTAMAVDPESLYVYWEVTDEAIERARAGLGPDGGDARLVLRVYDVTNRIFDGTNAHHYFDHSISRADRQWFFFLGRPSSTAVVEVGLLSPDGHFARIARSGRTDFPRREPGPPGGVEWLTVLSASGDVGETVTGEREAPPVVSGGDGFRSEPEPVRAWDIRRTHGGGVGERIIRENVRVAWEEGWEWASERTIDWEGPLIRTAWEAGPFLYPVEVPRYVEERYEGTTTVRAMEGRSHIVYGPWRVVIRGLGARAERRILGVWTIHRSWIADAGVAMRTTRGAASALGGSEQMVLGASELHWRAASEVRLGGASEIYLLGASELRYLGASETLYAGASEWLARGASELRYLGASEWRERGASELRYLGASERQERGASELRYLGASERLHAGASEWVSPGASENRPRYPAVPPPRA